MTDPSERAEVEDPSEDVEISDAQAAELLRDRYPSDHGREQYIPPTPETLRRLRAETKRRQIAEAREVITRGERVVREGPDKSTSARPATPPPGPGEPHLRARELGPSAEQSEDAADEA